MSQGQAREMAVLAAGAPVDEKTFDAVESLVGNNAGALGFAFSSRNPLGPWLCVSWLFLVVLGCWIIRATLLPDLLFLSNS
jgi:hypothetical protein